MLDNPAEYADMRELPSRVRAMVSVVTSDELFEDLVKSAIEHGCIWEIRTAYDYMVSHPRSARRKRQSRLNRILNGKGWTE